jgi:lipoprotein-releasing system permease protein
MNFPFYIARRYLISKKSRNIINIISGIAITGVMIGTMALVIVLSVFNGFEHLVQNLFNSFDPDIKITPQTGKTFIPEEERFGQVKQMEGVIGYSEVVEEMALIRYRERQDIIRMKGVDNNYIDVSGVDSMLVDGEFRLTHGSSNLAIVGRGISYRLGAIADDAFPASIYVPRRKGSVSMRPDRAFIRKHIRIGGIFAIEADYDNEYIFVPIRFARKLLQYTEEVTAIEVNVNPEYSIDNLKEKIRAALGPEFIVQDHFELNEIFYKVMKSEKLAIFMILIFILIVASFNIVGSLTMVILDKKEDIQILNNLGSERKKLKKIFVYEGWLITATGAFLGLILGLMISLIQQHYGIIKLSGSGSFVVDAYPVAVEWTDIIVIFITVLIIGYVSAWFPVKSVIGNLLKNNKN